MFPFRPGKLPLRQDGSITIEFLITIGLVVSVAAMLLQIGRTYVLYNVSVSAAYSAAMHMATMPEIELLDPAFAKPSAEQIVSRMRTGGGIDVSVNPMLTFVSCTPNTSAPCAGSVRPTQVHMRVMHIQEDTIFSIFTGNVDNQINQLVISYRARIPRVGFVTL
jgi:hypothetical protein